MASYDILQGDIQDHVSVAVAALKDGFVIIAPLENSYALMADAFFHDAVRAMHVLRGDELGVAAQVLAYSLDTVKGISRAVSPQTQDLCKKFWTGLLSISLKPSSVLNWDLGDDKELDWFNVRVPKSKFVRALLKESGPLAIASASAAGEEPMLKIDRAKVKDWDVAVVFDNGALKAGPRSTIIEADALDMRLVREGAISFDEMAKVAPNISYI